MIYFKEDEKMLEILKKIVTNVLTALYQPFNYAVVLAVLVMFMHIFVKERGWKNLIKLWIQTFKNNVHFRCVFLSAFYTIMILFRTLFNRNMWANPVSNVIGTWGLYNDKGELTTEVIENLILFIPFTILLLMCYREKIIGQTVKVGETLWRSVKIVFLFSLSIEFLQLFLRLGTFQLSDLFYNTLGGFVGGLIYWIGYKIHNKYKKGREE